MIPILQLMMTCFFFSFFFIHCSAPTNTLRCGDGGWACYVLLGIVWCANVCRNCVVGEAGCTGVSFSILEWRWTGVVFWLYWFVLTDYILYEKKATNISTDTYIVVVILKRMQRKTPIYACNNISDWPLWISGPLYKDSWTLNITQSESWEKEAWKQVKVTGGVDMMLWNTKFAMKPVQHHWQPLWLHCSHVY